MLFSINKLYVIYSFTYIACISVCLCTSYLGYGCCRICIFFSLNPRTSQVRYRFDLYITGVKCKICFC